MKPHAGKERKDQLPSETEGGAEGASWQCDLSGKI